MGEIIPVVAGILIAISLNNSNQNKFAEHDLEINLKKIREEIYQDSLRFTCIMEYNTQRITTIEKSIQTLEEELNINSYHNLVSLFIEIAGTTKTFAPYSHSYTGLINSGEFSKIKDDAIRDKLSFLYFYFEHPSKLNYSLIEKVQSFNQKFFFQRHLKGQIFHKFR